VNDFLSIFWLVMLALTAIYAGQLLVFYVGLSRLRPGRNERLYTVSVVIAARNEEHHIERCVASLLDQDYPAEKYTITVVDDQSTDRTGDIINELAMKNRNLRLLQLRGHPFGVSPIIDGINEAIKSTSGEIILRTDADCVVGPHWISSMVRHFNDDVGVISGLTLIEKTKDISSLLFGFQFIDLFSQTTCGAGAIAMNAPVNCNGSNLGIRRKAFEDVGGFESMLTVNSGSDSLLAQRIAATPQWRMRFAYEPESHATTLPVLSWRQLLHQRMRWAGHTSHYRFSTLVFLGASFFLYLLLFFLLPVSLFYFYPVPYIILAFKFAIDYRIISRFARLTRVDGVMKYFFVSELIHIPIILAAVFGSVFGSFEWKGRRMKREIAQHA